MIQELDVARDVYIDRDTDGQVLHLRHLGSPYAVPAATPQLAASRYLHSFGDILGLTPTALATLAESPSTTPVDAPVELRFSGEKAQFDTTTVAYQQTVLGLPVFEAGVAVQLTSAPFRVVSSQSTQHEDVNVAQPDPKKVKRALALTGPQLSQVLGIPAQDGGERQPVRRSIAIDRRTLVVHRFDPQHRQRDPERVVITVAAEELTDSDSSQPRLPLPAVPDSIRPGEHRVCAKVDFRLAMPGYGALNWTALIDVDTLTALYVRPFVDDVTGLVFEIDPSTSAGPAASATSTALNPYRVSRTLLGLGAPANGVQALSGDTVALIDSEEPTVAPPTRPAGNNFDYDSRTNEFSAVNAYVHCDWFFRLLDGMGFTRSAYLPGTTFPTSVDFRGFTGGPNTVNAHCIGTSSGAGILRTTFQLADGGDTSHPVGIADDLRVVLHELGGHGVLYNHVHSPNFGFAHSAGDSVAAILTDPGTQASDRFLTFPWISSVIARRHDRTPAAGWGWAGSIALNPFGSGDGGGYNNEQILSTTLFRLYRSIGGDSTDVNTQRFAARMAVYLIMRAIGTLTPSTNPGSAVGFEAALETADAGDWVSENITGGAYRKVIRWAFEKQGMFQPAGTSTPNNNVGAPPAVDVYVEDGRHGEYTYQPVFWDNQSIWNRRHADGGTTHEDPITNRTNYAYVKIKNRGTQTATNVVVKAYHANPAAGLSYPNDWLPMTTAQLGAANVPANSSGEIVVGPFEWTPRHVGHECMFMIVSATGDESNVDHIAAGDSIPEWRLVPHDNNIGQRNVAPVPGGTTGLVDEFSDLTFEAKNPLTTAGVVTLEHTLPGLLVQRGWKLLFTNRGGDAFELKPGESREVHMRLVPGQEFGPQDVEAAEQRTIQVAARVNGILVGGMSYQLDPTITRPNRPGQDEPDPGTGHPEHSDDCGCEDDPKVDGLAESLIRALERRQQKVREVEIKKLIVEIELEDCD
ncbi:MAG TPA: hypothetical protein VGK78_06760 [Nocardioides sp.]|uniref:hypothetical protein n=1 Tax=Nocardioides sp. TaxID=35761 RepID=UPI002F3E297D